MNQLLTAHTDLSLANAPYVSITGSGQETRFALKA
jgi:hypothetical protein